jgi:hypothetical protein
MTLRGVIGLVIRAIIGGVLIYSGASKAIAPSAEFAAALAAYQILPPASLSLIALVWPWLELFIGTYIFFGYYTLLFSGMAAGMFLVFLTVLGSAMLRRIDPGSCGCFGIGTSLSIHQTAFLDTGLLALSILLFILSRTPLFLSTDAWIQKNKSFSYR